MSPEPSQIEFEENKNSFQSKKQRLQNFYKYMVQTDQLKELSRDQFDMVNRVKAKVNEAKAANFSGFSSPRKLRVRLSKQLLINKVSTCDTSAEAQIPDFKKQKILKLQILEGFQHTSSTDKKNGMSNSVLEHMSMKRNNPILQNFMSI